MIDRDVMDNLQKKSEQLENYEHYVVLL